MSDEQILREDHELIHFTLGHVDFVDAEGRSLIMKDYRIKGEIWQVHKGDADPYPSRPHAHCIEGRGFYEGSKLHLGTRQLFKGSKPLDLWYPEKQFIRLCQMIQPKFPAIALPLTD